MMIELVWLLWAVLALAGFAWRPGAGAAWVVLVSGWALLPVVDYEGYRDAGEVARWFDVRGVALGGPVFWTKAVVIGLVVLAGVAAFDRERLRMLRWSWADLPMAAWCALPAVSALSAGLGAGAVATGVAYHLLAWGGPYVAGRVYLAQPAGRAAAARVFVVAGLVYVPFCLVEIVRGPFLYSAVYGFHPHQTDGASRWLGSRPVVLLEHGNALGIWMASLAVIAVGAWSSGAIGGRGARRWALAAVAVLVGAAVLTQSVGPIVLMGVGLGVLATARWLRWWVILGLVLLPVVGYVGFRLVDPVRLEPALERVLGGGVVDRLRDFSPARSLAWRVMREEEHVAAVRERPMLGHAGWDWWRGEHHAPWSLWMLTLGRYGLVGVATLVAIFVVPLAVFLYRRPPPRWRGDAAARLGAAMAVVLAMTLVDNMLNNSFNVVLVGLAGALIPADGTKEGEALAPAGRSP
ncbi:MAG: hypothetical protein WD009_04695 [Phycisphaeraceae bacterium]